MQKLCSIFSAYFSPQNRTHQNNNELMFWFIYAAHKNKINEFMQQQVAEIISTLIV